VLGRHWGIETTARNATLTQTNISSNVSRAAWLGACEGFEYVGNPEFAGIQLYLVGRRRLDLSACDGGRSAYARLDDGRVHNRRNPTSIQAGGSSVRAISQYARRVGAGAPKGRQAAQSSVVQICGASLSDPTSNAASPSMPLSDRYAGFVPCGSASRSAVRKALIGSPRMNFLKGRIAATEGGIAVALDRIATIRSEVGAFGPEVGTPVTIGVRPEHVALGRVGVNDVTLAVAHGEQLGGATTFIFPEPGFALQVPARHGERIALNLPPEHVHVLDTEEKVLPRSRPRPARAIVAGPAL
jgi:MalK OB fold domain